MGDASKGTRFLAIRLFWYYFYRC